MISSEVTLGNAFSDVPVEVSKYKIIIQYLELCGKLSTGQMICFKKYTNSGLSEILRCNKCAVIWSDYQPVIPMTGTLTKKRNFHDIHLLDRIWND